MSLPADVQEILNAARTDLELRESLDKVADWKTDQLKNVAVTMGAATAMNLGLKGVSTAYDVIKNSIMKGKNYKQMIESNPDLEQFDAQTVQKSFDTLHRFNPNYAADPLVAGAFVRNIAESSRINIDQINNIVSARKNIRDTNRDSGLSMRDLPMEMFAPGNPYAVGHADMATLKNVQGRAGVVSAAQTIVDGIAPKKNP